MKKKITTLAIVLVVLILGVVCYYFSNYHQEDKLEKELNTVRDLINASEKDHKEITKKLDKNVTVGDYALLEKSVKSYLRDCYYNDKELNDFLNDNFVLEMLSVKNYQKDGPEFKLTKKYIKETNDKMKECLEKEKDLLTEEKIMSYVNDKELDSEFIELYKKETLAKLEPNKEENKVDKNVNDKLNLLNNSEKVINFLVKNKKQWKIKDGKIVIKNKNIQKQYNKLVKAVK